MFTYGWLKKNSALDQSMYNASVYVRLKLFKTIVIVLSITGLLTVMFYFAHKLNTKFLIFLNFLIFKPGILKESRVISSGLPEWKNKLKLLICWLF